MSENDSGFPPAPGGSPLVPSSDDVVPPDTRARWFQAEERLYPVAMVMPDRYQAAVSLVGKVADDLRASCPDLATLVAYEPHALDLARRLVATEPAPAGDVDASLVAGAACSIRYRELAARRQS